MSVWTDNQVIDRVLEVLEAVHTNNAEHHFGRPYVTAYQLAIELDHRYPEIREQLGYQIGGAGVGERQSLAQYLARELSHRIPTDAQYPVQGAFVSNENVEQLSYRTHDGNILISSLTDTPWDLSMFRLREN